MSTGNAIGLSAVATVVDATLIDGSGNPVSGNAVFDALAALAVQRTAAQALAAQRAVIAVGAANCDYADQTNATHFGKVVGLTVAAAGAGAQVQIQSSGAATNAGWAFTPDLDVFLGSAGQLTQTEPVAGNFAQIVGYATTATTMWISIAEPIRI